MRAGIIVVTTAFLWTGAALADVDPVEELAEQAAQAQAPDHGRLGAFFHGAGKKTDWITTLQQGKCYFFSGAGGGGVKKLSLYLWDPANQRVTDNRARSPIAAMMHCPTATGTFKFQAKVEAGGGPYVVGLYVKGAPRQALAQLAPKPVAAVQAPAAAQEATCVDDGETGPAVASFSCDGVAIDVTLDGQFLQHNPGEMPIRRDVAPGCHRVKVDCWRGVFKHGVVYNGPVKFKANFESRFNARPGGIDLVGTNGLAPPPPAAPTISREQIQDAHEYLKDAIEVNGELESRCQGRVSGKLESIKDLMHDWERGSGELDRVLRKIDETRQMLREDCGGRVSGSLDKKLYKVARALGAQ